MPKYLVQKPLLASLGLIMLSVIPANAQGFEEIDPIDRVPRRISVEDFKTMSDHDLHMAALAVRHGRRILINGYPPSKSRRMIESAAEKRF